MTEVPNLCKKCGKEIGHWESSPYDTLCGDCRTKVIMSGDKMTDVEKKKADRAVSKHNKSLIKEFERK